MTYTERTARYREALTVLRKWLDVEDNLDVRARLYDAMAKLSSATTMSGIKGDRT